VLTLVDLYGAFGLDEDEPVRRLVRRAQDDAGLGALVLSAAALEGWQLGALSTGTLVAQQERAHVYAEIVARLMPAGVRVVKGAAVARYYPAGLRRPVGDLDLVAESEAALWSAAWLLVRDHSVEPVELTIVAGDERHVAIGFGWAAPDPLVESDLEVELATFAFPGDQSSVPLRAALPRDDVVAQLLSVAEEQHQRRLTVKDALDCRALLGAVPNSLENQSTLEEVEHSRRAPEVCNLVDHTRALFPDVAVIPVRLRLLAEQEQQRRGLAQVERGRWSGSRSARFGVYLGGAFEHADVPVREIDLSAGRLVCTAVGDFLMVAGSEVTQDEVDAAIAALPDVHDRAAARSSAR
jgi:hypothetical protein